MARVTITLPDELHQALKEAAAKRRRSLGGLVAESLEAYGIKTEEKARELVARARRAADLSEERALEVASGETRAARGR